MLIDFIGKKWLYDIHMNISITLAKKQWKHTTASMLHVANDIFTIEHFITNIAYPLTGESTVILYTNYIYIYIYI